MTTTGLCHPALTATTRPAGRVRVGRRTSGPLCTLRVTRLLLVVTPLLTGGILLPELSVPAALTCALLAGVTLGGWPWWCLYQAMREHERDHPDVRQLPWWQRWPWGSPPPPPRRLTPAERAFELTLKVLTLTSGLALLILLGAAWIAGVW